MARLMNEGAMSYNSPGELERMARYYGRRVQYRRWQGRLVCYFDLEGVHHYYIEDKECPYGYDQLVAARTRR